MDDDAKLQRKIDELNNKFKPATWFVASGFNTLPVIEFKKGQNPVIKPVEGIPVRAFINATTNEIKLFYALEFFKDEEK